MDFIKNEINKSPFRYIKAVSDLHLEFNDDARDYSWIYRLFNPKTTDPETVLILAGDINVGSKFLDPIQEVYPPTTTKILEERFDVHLSMLENLARQYGYIVYVTGNHEYYDHCLNTLDQEIVEKLDHFESKNVSFLNHEEEIAVFMDIKDEDSIGRENKRLVAFTGGTLWTDMDREDIITMNMARGMMNDYKAIRYSKYIDYKETQKTRSATPEDTVKIHNRHVHTIKEVLGALAPMKDPIEYPLNDVPPILTIVVTHHAPSSYSIDTTRFDPASRAHFFYYSNLNYLMKEHDHLIAWIHGHTHQNHDYVLNNTRVVCNPRGYDPFALNDEFDPDILFRVEFVENKDPDGSDNYKLSKVSC